MEAKIPSWSLEEMKVEQVEWLGELHAGAEILYLSLKILRNLIK